MSIISKSFKTLLKGTLAIAIATGFSGCLTQRTVTSNGQTVKKGFVFKRPLRDAISNSQ